MTKELPQTARRSFLSRFGIGAAVVAGVGAGLAAARPAVAQTNAFKPANSRLSCQIKFTDAMDGLAVTVAPAE